MTVTRASGAPVIGPNACCGERIHLIGIAGTGLRGLAGLLVEKGFQVSGSEACASAALDDLAKLGVECAVGHRESNLHPETQLVLISAAIREDNPELHAALRLGIPVRKYAQFLGLMMMDRLGIAVAGTHGKTTTTAMVTQALRDLGEDPGFIVGGSYPAIGGSSGWGSGKFFVAEACEFDRSFLNLFPVYAIVTNIEEDHLDYFNSLDEIQGAFGEFIGHLPSEGYLVINADDPGSAALPQACAAPAGSFSLRPGQGDWWAERIRALGGGIAFRAASLNGDAVELSLQVPGIHNVKNALAVLTLLSRLGHEPAALGQSLCRFRGVQRRFELLLHGPVTVIDDYGHHPTEIEMVIRAARETFPGRRLRLIFQPHQYSRTYRFLHGFAHVLGAADDVVVTEVYAARDSLEDMRRINAAGLVAAIRESGREARHLAGFDDIVGDAVESARPGDVFICLGAGTITQLAHRLAAALRPSAGERA